MFHGKDKTAYGQDYLRLHLWVQFFHLQQICVCVLFCFFNWCESFSDIDHHKRMS